MTLCSKIEVDVKRNAIERCNEIYIVKIELSVMQIKVMKK